MSLNKQYKDSVFTLLFSDPDVLRELYGAICGVPLDPAIPITINTLGRETARNLKAMGLPADRIAVATGLDPEEIAVL